MTPEFVSRELTVRGPVPCGVGQSLVVLPSDLIVGVRVDPGDIVAGGAGALVVDVVAVVLAEVLTTATTSRIMRASVSKVPIGIRARVAGFIGVGRALSERTSELEVVPVLTLGPSTPEPDSEWQLAWGVHSYSVGIRMPRAEMAP